MRTNASPPASSRIESNRREYRRHDTVERIRSRSGWIDIGERILVNRIADEVRSQAILDVGVGGGRTAWMLRTISRDYVAVDYSPEMVEACRHEYPGLDVRECDARDLSIFADGAFALVVFSFNGIDVLDHVGRLQALAEMHRVLRLGGLMLYSTLNKNGSLYGYRPWTRRQVSLPRYWREHRNWRRQKQFEEDHASWAICAAPAYEFRVLAHFTLPSTEKQALGSIGFTIEETLGRDGDPIEDDSTTTPYFYLLVRKTDPRL
jgi:SAM-dependent methyltransferase